MSKTHLVLIEVDENSNILGATPADSLREQANALEVAIEQTMLDDGAELDDDAARDEALIYLEGRGDRSFIEEDAFRLVQTLVERIDKATADRQGISETS